MCSPWQKNLTGPPVFPLLTGWMQESVLLPVASRTWDFEVHPFMTITASPVNVVLGSERSFFHFKLSNCSKCRTCNSQTSEEDKDVSCSYPCRGTALSPAPVASKTSSRSVLWRHYSNRSRGWCIVRDAGLTRPERTLSDTTCILKDCFFVCVTRAAPQPLWGATSPQQRLLGDTSAKIPVLNKAPKIVVGAPGAC